MLPTEPATLRLELALHPDDAARLSRLRAVAARRASRTRSRRLHMVWHDTPDAALEHQGLALLERAQGLRLERMRPNGTVWVPGTPAPVVDKVQREIAAIYADPAIAARLDKAGFDAESSTPEQFDAFIRSETARWGNLIKSGVADKILN